MVQNLWELLLNTASVLSKQKSLIIKIGKKRFTEKLHMEIDQNIYFKPDLHKTFEKALKLKEEKQI